MRVLFLPPLMMAALVTQGAQAQPLAAAPPWSSSAPALAERVRAGGPLVVTVVVALCSNDQIDCGASWAGQAGRLETNLYWGAVFGAKRFLLRPRSGWETVEISSPGQGLLEQAVFRRRVAGAPWSSPAPIDLYLVLQAVHGDRIDDAVGRFWTLATQGGTIRFHDGQAERTEPVSVAGYAGHNRLMDGTRLPAAQPGGTPIPSFVLACISERYFGERLRAAGSPTLLTTRALMAPEGYLVESVARAIGDNASATAIRAAAVHTSERWQRLPRNQAEWIFAPASGQPLQ